MVSLLSINEIVDKKEWFDYLVDTLSALGSLTTAGALWYVIQQSKMARVQQFENIFFQLLNLHNQIVAEIKRDETYFLFSKATEDIKALFIEGRDSGLGGTVTRNIIIENLDQAEEVLKTRYYEHYYKDYEHHFNHYFRNLYHLFKFIYESKSINWKQKKNYAAIARAQLSQKELFVIMFNAMHEGYGYPKFMFLIKKFNILDNFRHKEVEPHILYDYFQKLKDEVKAPEGFKD